MNLDAPFDRVVEQLYEAALDADKWDATLADAAAFMASPAVAFAALDVAARQVVYFRSRGLDEDHLRFYFARHLVNPWSESARRLRLGLVTRGSALVPFETLVRTPFYEEVVRPLEMVNILGVNLASDDDVFAFFTVNRELRAGDYNDEMVRRCQRLVPHLRRAARVQMRVATLEGQRVFALEALDQLRMGVVVVERRGRVVFLNTAAERMVAADDGLSVRRSDLVAATSQETAELHRLVARADGTAGRGGGEMTVARPSGRRALTMIVVPVALSESAPGLRAPAAILFITDPEARHERSVAHIRREFGLTLGEAALVQRLLSGRGLKAAADELGITRNTAHTHLQRAFGKTGTRRQAELLQLVLSGLPDLLHPNG